MKRCFRKKLKKRKCHEKAEQERKMYTNRPFDIFVCYYSPKNRKYLFQKVPKSIETIDTKIIENEDTEREDIEREEIDGNLSVCIPFIIFKL